MQSRLVSLAFLVALTACSGSDGDAATTIDPTLPAPSDGGASSAEGGRGPSSSPDSGVIGEPGGPVLLSVTTNVDRLTEGQSVRFVVLATHPGGLANLVGGKLSTPDGTKTYGAFTADQQGTYSLDLTWDQIDIVAKAAVPSGGVEPRKLHVEVFDTEGRKAEKAVSLSLFCPAGSGTVDGRCDPWSPCELPTRSCDEICGARQLTCRPRSCTYDGVSTTRLITNSSDCRTPAATWTRSGRECESGATDDSLTGVRCCCK